MYKRRSALFACNSCYGSLTVFRFDLQMPQCCDDEYWTHENAQLAFRQPENKPSYMSYFICSIQLSKIMHFALRTVVSMTYTASGLAIDCNLKYANTKTKAHSGFTGGEWLLRTISHLDSLLNDWSSSIPDHRESLYPHRTVRLISYLV